MTVISGTISECHMSQYAGVGIVSISRAGVGIVRIISRAGVGIATISREDIATISVLINRFYI